MRYTWIAAIEIHETSHLRDDLRLLRRLLDRTLLHLVLSSAISVSNCAEDKVHWRSFERERGERERLIVSNMHEYVSAGIQTNQRLRIND